jgi:hypothetical protein
LLLFCLFAIINVLKGEWRKCHAALTMIHIKELRPKALHSYLNRAAKGRRIRTRPRDQEEADSLRLLDRKRWEKALASGLLEKIGPRRYRWNG